VLPRHDEKRITPGHPLPGLPVIEHWLSQGIETPDQSLSEINLDEEGSIGVLGID